jgi:hypothetical protein
MFILYSSEIVVDRINISICTDTTLFVRLLFSVHFVVSILKDVMDSILTDISNCAYPCGKYRLTKCNQYVRIILPCDVA